MVNCPAKCSKNHETGFTYIEHSNPNARLPGSWYATEYCPRRKIFVDALFILGAITASYSEYMNRRGGFKDKEAIIYCNKARGYFEVVE